MQVNSRLLKFGTLFHWKIYPQAVEKSLIAVSLVTRPCSALESSQDNNSLDLSGRQELETTESHRSYVA
jgi:hypothetical protein